MVLIRNLDLNRLTKNLCSPKARARVTAAWVVNESEKIRKCCLLLLNPESNSDEFSVTFKGCDNWLYRPSLATLFKNDFFTQPQMTNLNSSFAVLP